MMCERLSPEWQWLKKHHPAFISDSTGLCPTGDAILPEEVNWDSTTLKCGTVIDVTVQETTSASTVQLKKKTIVPIAAFSEGRPDYSGCICSSSKGILHCPTRPVQYHRSRFPAKLLEPAGSTGIKNFPARLFRCIKQRALEGRTENGRLLLLPTSTVLSDSSCTMSRKTSPDAKSAGSTQLKNKQKSPRSKPAPDTSPVPWKDRLLAVFFRPKLLLWIGLGGAVFVVGPSLARFLPNLSQRDEYRMSTLQIQIPEPPRWVPVTILDQIIQAGDLPEHVSVLDTRLAEKVANALQKHPWVKGNVDVRITVPARVEATFEYRRPVAMVEIVDGFYAVDDAGVLLPPRDFPPSEVGSYPRIVGMSTTPTGNVGSTWGDARVTGASRIAVALAPWWREWNLSSIVVPERHSDKQIYNNLEFIVTTEGGSRIIWGRPPGHDHPLEIADDEKIKRLKKFLKLSQQSESLLEPWEVNINHLMEITYRPLPDRQAL